MKKIVIVIVVIILFIGGGVVVYNQISNKEKVQRERVEEINQKNNIMNEKIGNSNEGQLLEYKGISKDIFKDTKYPGISDEIITKNKIDSKFDSEQVKIVIKKYNPNILTQSTLIKYYKEQINNNENKNQTVDCYLLDVYNNSFVINMSNRTNKFNEFNVGNIDDKFELVDNKNELYCGIKPDGEITAYSSYGNNSGKVERFILKNKD